MRALCIHPGAWAVEPAANHHSARLAACIFSITLPGEPLRCAGRYSAARHFRFIMPRTTSCAMSRSFGVSCGSGRKFHGAAGLCRDLLCPFEGGDQRFCGDRFCRKSTAPYFICSTAIGTSPWPDRNTTASVLPRRRSSA